MPLFIDQYVLLILVSTTQTSETCILRSAICIDPGLDLDPVLRSTGYLLPNEYIYRTNSTNRSRDKNLDVLIGSLCFPVLYRLAWCYIKSKQIFCHYQLYINVI